MLTVPSIGDPLTDVEAKVEGFLNKMGVKYQKEEEVIASIWKIGSGEYWVFVLPSDKWVAIRARILEKDKLPEDVEFYRDLLRAHYILAGVRYDVDKDGNLGSSRFIPVEGLSEEIFESEFNSVVFAIDYFRQEIAQKYGIEL